MATQTMSVVGAIENSAHKTSFCSIVRSASMSEEHNILSAVIHPAVSSHRDSKNPMTSTCSYEVKEKEVKWKSPDQVIRVWTRATATGCAADDRKKVRSRRATRLGKFWLLFIASVWPMVS